MSADNQAAEEVSGERMAAAVHRVRAVQSRLGSFAALALMLALGTGALTWYYAHIWSAHGRVRRQVHSAAMARAQGDVPLPPLGQIDPPLAVAAAPASV